MKAKPAPHRNTKLQPWRRFASAMPQTKPYLCRTWPVPPRSLPGPLPESQRFRKTHIRNLHASGCFQVSNHFPARPPPPPSQGIPLTYNGICAAILTVSARGISANIDMQVGEQPLLGKRIEMKSLSIQLGVFLILVALGIAGAEELPIPEEKAAKKLFNDYKWHAFVDLTKDPPAIKWLSQPPKSQKELLEGIVSRSDTARPEKNRGRMKGILCANAGMEFRTILGTDDKVTVGGEKVDLTGLWSAMELLESELNDKNIDRSKVPTSDEAAPSESKTPNKPEMATPGKPSD